MADNAKIASTVIKEIGGKENVTNAWHCVTRLRFNLKDRKLAQVDAIKDIPGVMGAQFSGDQFQVIIGNTVGDVFEEVENVLGGTGSASGSTEKESIVSKLMDIISGIFTPILPALAGTGLIKGLLALALTLHWTTATAGWYQVLYMISDSVFYFLPFFVAVSATRKFKTSEYLGLSVAGVLLYPTMVNAYNAISAGKKVAAITLFSGVNVPYVNYTSSVIPIILGVWFLAIVQRWVKKWMPDAITMMFTPMVTLVIVVPVTLLVFGPLGTYAGNGLAVGISWLFTHAGPVAGLVLGATFPLIVMTGMHYAFVPIVVNNFKVLGYDATIFPINFVTNMAQAGSAFAVAIRSKNAATKQLATSSGISALLGITEPAMYGINLKKKKPFYAALAAGGIAGAFVTFFAVKAFAMAGLTGLTALPVFISAKTPMNIVWLAIGITMSFVLSFIFTLVLGFEDDVVAAPSATKPVKKVAAADKTTVGGATILAPVQGTLEPLSSVADDTFAQGIMGKGAAIIPEDGEIVAPISGKVTVLPDSKHAVGITGDDGTELLVHVGIDTVELGGKFFTAAVKAGDHVTAGQKLLSFDLKQIKEKGYDPTVMIIVTNSNDFTDVLPMNESGVIYPKEQLLVAIK
ncbi:beta-glucoside-specific PTS transporter subunit IIABC [Schleiferilactobacillus perolens]|uniref:PTS system sucrose-specific EIIBCA component n=1 Tax=Schleiferilactobacillus perolens DSM 12744 TaxID=1423792 RepID=A0A0R1NCI7_9LACO|nr:beta-glucoside-specific PTS transporter subunit IIABC [Schleiferilactobacillus perolens]KRL14523.1 phosphotransferase system (PTS) enzyme I [Schleiferilactobacillus perolens DSM 12744]